MKLGRLRDWIEGRGVLQVLQTGETGDWRDWRGWRDWQDWGRIIKRRPPFRVSLSVLQERNQRFFLEGKQGMANIWLAQPLPRPA